MKPLILFVLAFLLPGCTLALGATDCEREVAAIEAAAARCNVPVSGRDCENVVVSSGADVDSCIQWYNDTPCGELVKNTDKVQQCQLSLLVDPL